jgi:hypothetical protein
MIAEFADRVRTRMAAKKFPHPVTYAPERAQRKGFAMGIVFRRDREAGDGIGAPAGWKGPPDPRVVFDRRVGGVVEVYARASVPGATVRDHEEECDRVCDGVLCAMYYAAKGFLLQVTESRLLRADELEGQDAYEHAGCAARIAFSLIDRVRDVDYTGAGPDTADIAAVELTAVNLAVAIGDETETLDPTPEP